VSSFSSIPVVPLPLCSNKHVLTRYTGPAWAPFPDTRAMYRPALCHKSGAMHSMTLLQARCILLFPATNAHCSLPLTRISHGSLPFKCDASHCCLPQMRCIPQFPATNRIKATLPCLKRDPSFCSPSPTQCFPQFLPQTGCILPFTARNRNRNVPTHGSLPKLLRIPQFPASCTIAMCPPMVPCLNCYVSPQFPASCTNAQGTPRVHSALLPATVGWHRRLHVWDLGWVCSSMSCSKPATLSLLASHHSLPLSHNPFSMRLLHVHTHTCTHMCAQSHIHTNANANACLHSRARSAHDRGWPWPGQPEVCGQRHAPRVGRLCVRVPGGQ